MPKQYSMGGRVGRSVEISGAADGSGRPGGTRPGPRSLRERFSALRNLPPFLKLIWQTSPAFTVGDLALRLVRALLPVVTLYVGKLIIDEVVLLLRTAGPQGGRYAELFELQATGYR